MQIVGENDVFSELMGDDEVRSGDLPGGFAGLGQTAVPTLTTANISVALNAVLRPDRLVLGAAAVVDLCRVNDIKVGTTSLNVGSLGACARAFAHDAQGTRLRGAVTASPTTPPIVQFYNGTAATIQVEGALFGPVAKAT
jgi:hypothetical protein